MINVQQLAALVVIEEQSRCVEQLQRIVFRRIVRRGNGEASARADGSGVKLDGRRGEDADVDHFATGGEKSALHRVLQHRTGGAGIASHHHASTADVGSEGLRESASELRSEEGSDDAADAGDADF